MSLVVSNGKIYLEGTLKVVDILIEDGIIKKIGRNLKADEKVNARGNPVLPGLIDPHVHLREPGAEKKEDFNSGTRAALAGGFTSVIDMPNNPVPTVTAGRLQEKEALAAKKAHCNVYFHFGASENNFNEVKIRKPISLKLYMGLTTGEMLISKQDAIKRHFKEFPAENPIVVHAATSLKDESADLKGSMENIDFVIELARKYARAIHLAHVSTKSEAVRIKAFSKATCEYAPHYIFLSKKDAGKLGYLGSVYPALRSEPLRKELSDSLALADCIATDHAPHTLEDKQNGAHGFPGLETSLPLMLELYHKKKISLDFIVSRMAENPARIFHLKNEGKIAEGFQANLTIVDMKKEWVVEGDELETKCKWSPFEGRKMKGKADSVIYKGNLVLDEGELRVD